MMEQLARRIACVVAVSALAATLTVVMIASPAGAEPTGCQPGFGDPGAATLEEGLALPRIQTGLDQGVYTVAVLTEQFDAIDANNDGRICLKAVSNLEGNSTARHAAFYGAIDNRHPRK